VRYRAVDDDQALYGVKLLARTEGIIPALETAHAMAFLPELAREIDPDSVVVVNCSGRGDKDMNTIAARIGTGA
jgi:tryptophan synthase beta chain